MTRRFIAAVGTAALLSCAKQPEPQIPEPIGETHTFSALAPDRTAPDKPMRETVLVEVTSRMRTACKMPEAPRQASAFEFDAFELRPVGEDVLHDIAACLAATETATKRVCVNGYAARRRAPTVEENLARAHAEAAKRYLERLGVAAARIDATLRYEEVFLGAEKARAVDRRVEIDVPDSAVCLGKL